MVTIADKSPFVLLALRSNRTIVKVVVDFLVYVSVDAPRETILAALGDLRGVLDDTESLLKDAFGYEGECFGASRLPKRPEKPLPPAEAIDILQVSLDIMQIEVESLLREPWATDEEYLKIAHRRDHVIKIMGHMARFYKAALSGRIPSAWSLEIEKRFEKFLSIKP